MENIKEKLVKQAIKLTDRYPTPWKVECGVHTNIRDNTGKFILRIVVPKSNGFDNWSAEDEQKLAEHIVKCVNVMKKLDRGDDRHN